MEIGSKYDSNVNRVRLLSRSGVVEVSRSPVDKCGCYLCESDRFDDFLCLDVPVHGKVSERYFIHEGCFVSMLEEDVSQLN